MLFVGEFLLSRVGGLLIGFAKIPETMSNDKTDAVHVTILHLDLNIK